RQRLDSGDGGGVPLLLDRRDQLFGRHGALLVLDLGGTALQVDLRVANAGLVAECLLHGGHTVATRHPTYLQTSRLHLDPDVLGDRFASSAAAVSVPWTVCATRLTRPGCGALLRPHHLSRPGAAVSNFTNLILLDHPLIRHKLGVLRDRHTPTKIFKELVDELAMLMAYEATKDLPLETHEIETPLERTTQERLAGKKLTVVPVLRAGLGMVEGVLRLVPSARVGHIGLYRDHDTLQPVDYYFKIPADAREREFLVLDPMLATGGSAAAAIDALKARGAASI